MLRHFVLTLALLAAGLAHADDGELAKAIAGKHRTPDFAARDHYRHPQQTLEFFGIQPEMTVVEVWPGLGWWTEILAPYLRAKGRYYAAHYASESQGSAYRREQLAKFKAKLAARPELYDRVTVTTAGAPAWQLGPPGSADLVLTFRNVHNWLSGGYEHEMFAAMYRVLKPGGVLGIKEHRGRPNMTIEQIKDSGYVPEDTVIQLAELAGFRLLGRSEINANPADSTMHPEGVWTLPPTLRLGETDRQKYLSIGESDRMTLKFVKPLLVSQ